METINANKMKEMITYASRMLIENEYYLCSLDSVVGDGDHGVTIAKGFKKVLETFEAKEFESIGEVFTVTGNSLMSAMGGAIGPIFGSIFTAAGKICHEKKEAGINDLLQMFEASLTTVKKSGMPMRETGHWLTD